MKNKISELLSFLFIVFFLILMSNLVIKSYYAEISLANYSKYIYICGGVGLLLYIYSKIKNFKFNKYEIIVFVMIILSFLSLLNAIDITTAIFGKYNRYEGLLVWLSYYIFLLNAMNIKKKVYLYIIVLLFLMYMVSNTFYGLYQIGLLGKPVFFKVLTSFPDYAVGFLGNPNFLGSLSCIFYGLILGLFIKVNIGLKKYLLGILLLISNLCVIINGSMSAFVAIVVINLLCLIQIIVLIIKKRENSLKYLGSLIVGIISFVSVFFVYSIDHPNVKNDIMSLFNQTKSIVVDKKVEDSFGSGRIEIWRNVIEKIKVAPITGYGIDNCANVFGNKPFPGSDVIVDKAHNDYLQKALCEGIISSVVFIVFLLSVFFKGLFSKLSPIYYGLLLSFTCYSVQAFFNISFTNVAPIYFIIIGLLIGGLPKKNRDTLTSKESIV